MPPGRAWIPPDKLVLDHLYMVPDRFEPIRQGRIELVARGYYGAGGQKSYGFEWADSAWRVRWTLPRAAYYIWPALTPSDRQMLVWKAFPPVDSAYNYYCYMVTSDVVGDLLTPPDTIARVDASTLSYSGTSWGNRRWVVMQDGYSYPEPPLRIYRSDSGGRWVQVRTPGLDGLHGIEAVAIDSTSILVVTCEAASKLRWATLRDTDWTVDPAPLSSRAPLGPSLARLGGGSLRIGWATTDDFVCLRSYRGSDWGPTDTLRAELPYPEAQYLFYDVEQSSEIGATPAIAWDGYGLAAADGAYHIWVSFPRDSGYEVGQVVPGTWDDANPILVRDENEDVWLAWWRWDERDGLYWTHSYSTAIPRTPAVDEVDGRPRLRWLLSEPSPYSWWGVMRSVNGAPSERVARLRASWVGAMSWSDSTAPPGASLRYSIRRECRDVRYQVTSGETKWRPRGAVLALTRRGSNPVSSTIDLDLSGADAGSVEVRLYDLQGRVVSSVRFTTAGTGIDELHVPLDSDVHSGLYFIRVRGSDGRISHALKVALIR
jgi:hypothetical protein